jgi:hypothetical protein
MWILIIICILNLCVAGYFFYRAYVLAGLLADAEEYNIQVEQLTNYMYRSINNAYDEMKRIDRIGAFEADDESGTTFKLLLQVIEDLQEEFDGTPQEEE